MIANNEPRAYIVHATEDAMRSLSDFDFTFTPKETFRNAETLDLEALRLVVEAAKLSIGPVFEIDFGLSSAIKKIESILK